MARALIWLRNTTDACVTPRSAFPTTSPVRVSSATLSSPLRARTIARYRMDIGEPHCGAGSLKRGKSADKGGRRLVLPPLLQGLMD
jgi:hypothetical protein